ncbi:DUF421 domain-containing protein [Swaminathania salitolerans]|uniref:DUF421 domain-containing protein n=1 Tax=Swaminathania salitolerans TaxID=182838 RepID=A0A511BRB2_9PROT|nr:YetF domain-containing protein [Swaminathania salitolerans]GBQ13995.1 hypothetical protein AA21291_1685 [Swaminathania salitolerans LMG 21291]GEL02877.1 DUF421 domain-containing protein [Swaminathania salitolerans]
MITLYLWVILKLVIGFTLIISYLNVTGRNQIAMMTSVDLVGNFILGGVVGGILYNDKLPILHYIALLVLCILLMALFNALSRKIPGLRKRTIGEPITIIRDGRFLIGNFEENASRIDIKDVATALRMQNIFSFDRIAFAQIETTGHVSVIMQDEAKKPSRFLVHRGEILQEELRILDRDEAWLLAMLTAMGLPDPDHIFLAEWVGDHMLVVTDDGIVHGE